MAADEDAFLRAIAENPADDLPRLVYADWLDEHGHHGRAEFVRLDCERRRSRPTGREWETTDARLRRLLAGHDGPYGGAVWFATGFQRCRRIGGRLTRRLFDLEGVITARVGFSAGAPLSPVRVNGQLVECQKSGGAVFDRQTYSFRLAVNYRAYAASIVINFAFGLPGGTTAFYLGDTLIYAEV
jgi:uncharacterized protein (TIGR02996 family)